MANLTFADTHNMVTYLSKSDASIGFNQMVDFLNAQVIQYALMVNPTIYVSCIKQFWATVSIKKVKDVVKLQALIDRKKEIFVELVRMGYEKQPLKLIFYKAFFTGQWKFLIHTLVQCMMLRGLPGMNSVLLWPQLLSSLPQYAVMVNPTIYVSCIKQFWATVSIKKVKDVVKLQALIDRKKVVVTEDIIR
nr:hypothetical protein [Tanacetum cinerariifolium]